MPAPLAGLRVLDLSRVLAGPWCTQLLADLGADVAKVERPGTGDDTRGWGPPFLPGAGADAGADAGAGARPGAGAAADADADADTADGASRGDAAYFLACNRGKRSLAIDFSQAPGADLVRRLADASDVLVENFKPGDLVRYGLDPAALRARNPRLVTCSITGYGTSGPLAARPGYDAVIQATSGLMSVTGAPGGEPTKFGVALVDVLTGLYAANGIQAALLERERTGRGRQVDVALLDVAIASLANQAAAYLVSGQQPARLGNAHPHIVPYQTFTTADGHLVVTVGSDGQFRKLCAALDAPDLADDPRFARNAGRVRHRDVLVPRLAGIFAQRTSAVWDALLAAAGVPCGPVLGLDAVFASEHVRARRLRVEHVREDDGCAAPDAPDARDAQKARADDARGRALPGVACPVRIDDADVTSRRAPPALGAHTDAVLREWLGMDAAECATLRAEGVL